jgi:hypothetical protein
MSFNLANGISAAGYGAGELYGKKSLMDAQAEIDTKRDEAATQRAMRLEEFKQSLGTRVAEEQRTAQVARIDAKAGELADSSLAPKRGLIDSGIVDRGSWTPEQQAAVDQSLALDRDKAARDPKIRTDAAIATGDISPKEAATIERDDRRLDVAERSAALKEKLEMLREEGRNARAERSAELQEQRLQVMLQLGEKRLEAAGKKAGEAANSKEALSFLEGQRKDLASEAQDIRQRYQAELKGGGTGVSKAKQAEIEAAYAPKFAAVEERRRLLDSDYNALREKVGLPARGTAPKADPATPPKPAASGAPAPKADAKPAAPIKKLPDGARQIGTSGGKPVYETPDGKRFIAQ